MMRKILLTLTLAAALGAQAINIAPTDSVWLRQYAAEDGSTGMRLEWSTNQQDWHSIGDGYDFVRNDFGPWGSHKKMFSPQLWRQPDGSWVAQWYVSPERKTVATVCSPDLMSWGYQDYQPGMLKTGPESIRVPFSVVKNLIDFTKYRGLRGKLDSETCADDHKRYAGLKNVQVSAKALPDQAKPISDKLIGIFFEDINYGADGGLYAELIRNRDFEFSNDDNRDWNATTGWTVKGDGMTLSTATENPIHANNATYAVLNVATPGAALINGGFDGIPVKRGEKYDLSVQMRGGSAEVALVAPDGTTLAKTTIKGGKNWKKSAAVLVANADCDNAALSIKPLATGTYDIDMVSLFPQKTFKGRKNGLRPDLAQTLADLHPRFVRFPGGCVAHGNGVDNIYDWKGSIGALEARKPLSNLWGYHQTRGLGYYEYFLFCEDIGAEPLPVLAAGVPCQNSGRKSHHSHDEATSYGQQGGVPMEEMDAYVQDVLDLIEWANGDPKKSEWAKKRAEAGHPAPFNLKYVGIGNEDLINPIFDERFKMIYDAVQAKYPEITVVGTVGPFYEGTDYDEGWRFATQENVPIVDEHYYVSPGWLINNRDYYDCYDRNAPKVYLGEYASHNPDRTSTMETALSDALYLTDVERNADVVVMTSYAPLLAKKNHTQWNPDMIYFTNTQVMPTTDYWVQQMYGQNSGSTYIPVSLDIKDQPADVSKRVGISIVKDAYTGDIIVKAVNMLPVKTDLNLDLADLAAPEAAVDCTVLTGAWDSLDSRPYTFEATAGSLPAQLPPYSFSVYRIKAQ